MDNKDKVWALANKGDLLCQKLFGHYEGLKNFLVKQKHFMTQYGISRTVFGRIRKLPGLQQDKFSKDYKHWLKAGFNQPIQGMGASITRRAMIELFAKGYKIVTQVHDSIVVEVHKDDTEKALKEVSSIMENVVELRVPLVAEPKVLTSLQE